jgi:choline dehydrogenase-like flavoprotein
MILEAGPPVDRSKGPATAFANLISTTPEAAYPISPWAPKPSVLDPNGYYVQTGPDTFGSTYERQVGGTTWHWLGTAIRLVPSDFRMQTTYGVGVDWPIAYDDLEPWYLAAEHAIGVAGDGAEDNGSPRSGNYPMPAIPLTYSDTRFARAATGLGLLVTATPQARVSVKDGYNGRPQCCGNAFCLPMCPIGAKYDATVHLDLATQAGAQLMPNSVVCKLDTDAGGTISALHYRRPDRSLGTLTARVFVVAAHAIETPKLLLMSATAKLPNGLANASDQVGRNLMDHPTQLSYALANDPMGPYRAPLTTAGIEQLRDGAERAHRSAFRIEIGNDGWSWPGLDPVSWSRNLIEQGIWGKSLYGKIAELNLRAVRMAALCEQLPDPNSRVTLSDQVDDLGIPRPALNFVVDDYANQGHLAARGQLSAIFQALGVQELTHVDQVKGAGHIMGTYRMGDDPTTSVTDSFGRTWDHPNLWLAGSGLFPTVGTANPTLTIAALALRAAPEIDKALGTGA